ncbi:hypothetical protein L9F63_018621, partial [Diploptera punctata]
SKGSGKFDGVIGLPTQSARTGEGESPFSESFALSLLFFLFFSIIYFALFHICPYHHE